MKPPVFNATGKQICGAKTRTGGVCQTSPVVSKGSNRCRMHGGSSISGLQNALKHGIYVKQFSPDELQTHAEIVLGGVDEELKLCKIRLARALLAEADESAMVLDTQKETPTTDRFGAPVVGALPVVEKTYKRRDFVGIIDRLVGRIESLERARAEINAKAPSNSLADVPVGGVTVTIQTGKAPLSE